MKSIIYISFFILIGSTFSSCEDVIELDLDTTEPRLVIEGTLDAGTQMSQVLISRSNDFYDPSGPEPISGASISLQGEDGAVYTLAETSDGTYRAENVAVNPGEEVMVAVEVEGILYEAVSRVPYPVNLKEIVVAENAIETPFGDDGEGSIALSANWDDLADIENFYRIRTYLDGAFQSDSYLLLKDVFVGDGAELSIPLPDRFEENSTVTLELLSTDEPYYDYFFQVSSVAGDGAGSTTPFNPVGNFSPNVLGYFGIYYASSLTIDL